MVRLLAYTVSFPAIGPIAGPESLQAITSLAVAFLGLLFELHLTETQREARRDITTVEHLSSAVAEIVRVGVARTRTDAGAPVEDVLNIDEHRQTTVEEVAAETHVEEITCLALTHQADGR